MGDIRGGDRPHQPETAEVLDAFEQSLAGAEQRGGQVDLHLVHQAGLQVLLARFAPPASDTSFPRAARRACSSADSMPSVTKVKLLPPSSVSGGRGWWVSTNTGW